MRRISSPSGTATATPTRERRSPTCATPSTRPRGSTGCPMHEPHLEDLASSDWSRLTVGQMWGALGEADRGGAMEQAGGGVKALERLDHPHAGLQEYVDLLARRCRGVPGDAFLRRADG